MAKKPVPPSKPNLSASTPAPVTTVTEQAPTPSVTLPDGSTQILGEGLWGIVGKNSRYGTVTQFSGLEYVRYEYRRIPEEFRAAAFVSTFLEVVEITKTAGSVSAADVAPVEIPAVVEPAPLVETPVAQDPAEEEILEG